jgi:hypothetical protein
MESGKMEGGKIENWFENSWTFIRRHKNAYDEKRYAWLQHQSQDGWNYHT